MTKYLVTAICFLMVPMAVMAEGPPTPADSQVSQVLPEGFYRYQTTKGPAKDTVAKVPKDWRLVGVMGPITLVSGTYTQLWFEGQDGNIYLVYFRIGEKGEYNLGRDIVVIERTK